MYKSNDKIINQILSDELARQQNELELIASENYVSRNVLESYSNVFTNKYSEGYPGKRYYGGQKNVDKIETLTQYRALKIFDLIESCDEINFDQIKEKLKESRRGVNVQPLSGSPANLAVYVGVLKPGDKILAMDLNAGGHLSHGFPISASGMYYNVKFYGVNSNDLIIDYDEILQKALEFKPQIILAGFSAYPRNINWQRFYEISLEVEKLHGYRPILMADIAHIAGLIAGGEIDGPFDFFDVVTTTTHKTLRGPRGALIYFRKEDFGGIFCKMCESLKGFIYRNGEKLDLEKLVNKGVFPGVQGGPHEHIILAKAVALGETLNPNFKKYVQNVLSNAKVLAQELIILGWNVLTGGTDNHIILFDVTKNAGKDTGLTGKIAEQVLEKIGISVNKNMIPFDARSPLDPSGIRIGTPAITTRGLLSENMKQIAQIINDALLNCNDENKLLNLKEDVVNICKKFPLEY